MIANPSYTRLTNTMSKNITLTLTQVHDLAQSALQAQGFSAAQAGAIAATITKAERDECKSHGLFRVPFYVKALANPETDASAQPQLSSLAGSVVRVDAKHGFCPLALQTGLPALADKAREQGIAALAINNAYNIAALWPEVEELAEQGLVAMAFTCANAYVAPAGGTKPVFGTNPMAFSWPRHNRPPLVFDQASSASARGEIQLHLRDGHQLPEGWAIDAEGNPTTDPQAALDGAQLPFGGYKGSAIALMVELLAGALIGDLFSFESSERDIHGSGAPFGGEFVLAINPAQLQQPGSDQEGYLSHAETLFERILQQEGTRLPGDRRFAARQVTASRGVEIPQQLHETIQEYI